MPQGNASSLLLAAAAVVAAPAMEEGGVVQEEGEDKEKEDLVGKNPVPYNMPHVTTKGGAATSAANTYCCSRAINNIKEGKYNALALIQTNVDKASYPQYVWGEIEPLERREVYLNNKVGKNNWGGGNHSGILCAVSVVPADDTVSMNCRPNPRACQRELDLCGAH